MLDEYNCWFILRNGIIDLTVLENKILKILIENKEKYISLKEICEYVYREIDFGLMGAIRTHITRLRKKIKPEYNIINRYNKGYIILYKYIKD